MERRSFATRVVLLVIILCGLKLPCHAQNDAELLRVRETVWRAWFDGDQALLSKLVPPGSIAINGGSNQWDRQAEILKSSAEFHKSGGKLIRLVFPRTEVQHFGDVAVTYSDYQYETELNGKHETHAGRATEVFVMREGQWTNPGWHTDAGPSPQ